MVLKDYTYYLYRDMVIPNCHKQVANSEEKWWRRVSKHLDKGNQQNKQKSKCYKLFRHIWTCFMEAHSHLRKCGHKSPLVAYRYPSKALLKARKYKRPVSRADEISPIKGSPSILVDLPLSRLIFLCLNSYYLTKIISCNSQQSKW